MEHKMSELNVRIVKLDPMRVVSAYGFGPSPEMVAWQNLVNWARPKGFMDEPEAHRIFGFNNPDPSSGSPNYGYEFWMEIGPEIAPDGGPEGEIRMQDFAGGLYAATGCVGVENITATWKKLVEWLAGSKYGNGRHQWLEQHLSPDGTPLEALQFNLFIPIIE
jgi:DNA gyrase inhibitor GyrI